MHAQKTWRKQIKFFEHFILYTYPDTPDLMIQASELGSSGHLKETQGL